MGDQTKAIDPDCMRRYGEILDILTVIAANSDTQIASSDRVERSVAHVMSHVQNSAHTHSNTLTSLERMNAGLNVMEIQISAIVRTVSRMEQTSMFLRKVAAGFMIATFVALAGCILASIPVQ